MKLPPLNSPLLLILAAVAVGCGDDAAHGGGHIATDAAADVDHDVHVTQDVAADEAPADRTTGEDAPADAAATPDGAAGAPMLNDCVEAGYVDRTGADAERIVRPRGTTGYTPRCVTVRVGQSVTFEMDFSTHPLVPGIPHGPTAGATSPNPIRSETTGMNATVTFPGTGYFPFYCTRHAHVGMAGVVRVVP